MPPTRLATLLALAGGTVDALAAHPPPQASGGGAVPAAPLVKRLDGLVASPVFHPTETGIALVALPEGRTIYAHNAARLLRPASTLKIITSAAALALLKPEFV
jgi:D-alanyl-D-alanine carboxypeptidase/D-alanyl-D-alanine-endopeptidase (penicillin-binding protein 4)